MNGASILIVEDEVRVAQLLSDYLQLAGFVPHMLENGSDVLPWLSSNKADLILLDLMLPGTPGEKVCADIRNQNYLMPIIIITAKVEEINRILGLELGADDYMCKPLSPREVVARVKAALRRQDLNSQTVERKLHLDESRLIIAIDKRSINVTSIEFQLIRTLASDPGRIWSRIELMDCLYQDNRVVHHRTVDGHVKKLRIKMKALFGEFEVVQSVYGAGYRLSLPEK